MAPKLCAFAEQLTSDKGGRVVPFTTSNRSRRTVRALRKILKKNGVQVENKYFHAHITRVRARTAAAVEFARGIVS